MANNQNMFVNIWSILIFHYNTSILVIYHFTVQQISVALLSGEACSFNVTFSMLDNSTRKKYVKKHNELIFFNVK